MRCLDELSRGKLFHTKGGRDGEVLHVFPEGVLVRLQHAPCGSVFRSNAGPIFVRHEEQTILLPGEVPVNVRP